MYLDPGGTDAGSCGQSSPCRQFLYALTQTSVGRNHIVLAPGGYVENVVRILPTTTSATLLHIHGNGASLSQEGDSVFNATIPVRMRDIEFFAPSSTGLVMSPDTLLERVKVHGGYYGLSTNGTAVLRDVELDGNAYGIDAVGALTLDRVVIRDNSINALRCGGSTSLNITNLLTYGNGQLALDVVQATGTIAFSTIVDSGASTPSTVTPSTVYCGSGLTIRSSIIWSGTTARVPVQGCNLVSTIAGPAATPGAMNVDPMFVNSSTSNYHLGPGSPARDAADTGPVTDFEGDARPQGTRFDIGADEAAP